MDATVSMDRWAGKVALVTGASCGIGAAITRALIRCGMIVVGCARNVDRIKVNCCSRVFNLKSSYDLAAMYIKVVKLLRSLKKTEFAEINQCC